MHPFPLALNDQFDRSVGLHRMLGQTVAIVKATTAFLNLLTPEQRDDVQFPFSVQPSATAAHFKGGLGGNVTFTGELYGQSMWSNFPVSDVPRRHASSTRARASPATCSRWPGTPASAGTFGSSLAAAPCGPGRS